MTSHWTSKSFSEYLRQADLSMLALRVVAARVFVILTGSFMSQTETGPTLTWFWIRKGYTVPICLEPSAGVTDGCAKHCTSRTSDDYDDDGFNVMKL